MLRVTVAQPPQPKERNLIKKQWVIDHWTGVVAASKALGVSHQALSKAPEVLPRSMERRVRAKVAAFNKQIGGAAQ
jgi:hypothetical protein